MKVMPMISRREWIALLIVTAVMLVITGIPYFYAQRIAPPETHFMGVVVNIPDHFQYFSWMRESETKVLVPNQMTPEDNSALLFNLLWWVLGRIEGITGLSYITLYQITRLLGGAFTLVAIYFFMSVIFTNVRKRWLGFLVATLATGVGYIWVIEKAISDRADVLFPFTLFTAEPNTFYTTMAFPHFTIATGLITLIFALVLLAQKAKNLHFAWVAAAVSLLLALQHSYDMFTIYGVIGMYGLFLWIRDRKFPLFMFKTGLIIALISVWPALQAYLITSLDPVWQGVLSQFDNAGAWTPAPYLLPILMGFAWLLALWALDIRTPWRERDDTHLFVLAWFLSHFILIYIPLNFQIHLLSGWQVVIGALAAIGLYTRVLPILGRFFKSMPQPRLALLASAALVLLVVPGNLYLYAQRFLDLRRAENVAVTAPADQADRSEGNIYFLSNGEYEAMQFLNGKVTDQDVVISSLKLGQFIPALTGGRAMLAHWAQTLDFYGKRDTVAAFYSSAMTDAEREALIRQYGIRYVIYSPIEAALGDYDLAASPLLTPVHDQNGVLVYEVRPEVALVSSGG